MPRVVFEPQGGRADAGKSLNPIFGMRPMRRILSLTLLLVLAFNWLGYEMVVGILIERNRLTAQRTIDQRGFDEGQLIEIQVPLPIPYGTDWPAFEAVEGVVTYQGAVYNFVERKYEKGRMVYRCLPNRRGTELQNAREYFQSLVFDLDAESGSDSAPKQASTVKKPSLETTVLELTEHRRPGSRWPAAIAMHRPAAARDGFGLIPAEPPEA